MVMEPWPTMPKNINDLPYRPCAGIMLANTDGKIFVGRRIDNPGSEAWQMPQGGIDDNEDPRDAAIRELFEETGISYDKVEVIAQTQDELFYDLPEDLIGKLWKGKWRGQRQIWFLMRFKGNDDDVNIATKEPEFAAWQWVDPQQLPHLIVPFKKRLYEMILAEFEPLI
jgi:putative (di)nucleoside polyphosphate hydrolase